MDLRHPEPDHIAKVPLPPVRNNEHHVSVHKERRDSSDSSSSSDDEKKQTKVELKPNTELSEAFKKMGTTSGSTYSSSSNSSSAFHQEFKKISSSGSSQFVGKKVESSSFSSSGMQVTQRVTMTSSSSSSKSITSSSTSSREYSVSHDGKQEVKKVENWCGTKTPEQMLQEVKMPGEKEKKGRLNVVKEKVGAMVDKVKKNKKQDSGNSSDSD